MNGDLLYVRHMLDAIEKIESYTRVGRERFLQESVWHDAAIRQLEIIGEATKQLSAELRANHPRIPWRRFAGLRDVLIHNYMGVVTERVWDATQSNLPDLKRELQIILVELGDHE